MSNCTCETEVRPANAEPITPYFPGIRRFTTTHIVRVSANCFHHGFMTHPDFHPAADLRYGD